MNVEDLLKGINGGKVTRTCNAEGLNTRGLHSLRATCGGSHWHPVVKECTRVGDMLTIRFDDGRQEFVSLSNVRLGVSKIGFVEPTGQVFNGGACMTSPDDMDLVLILEMAS